MGKAASIRIGILLIVVLTLSSGCASMIRHTKRLDMGPFGENTTMMVNDIQYGLLSMKPLYLKPYLQGPDFVEFKQRWSDQQRGLRGIVQYATQVVSLSRSSTLKGPEKAATLAKYIEPLVVPVIEHANTETSLTRADVNAALEAIRSKETLLAALGAAQPLIDAVQNFSLGSFEKLHGLAQQVLQEAQGRIEGNSAAVLEHAAGLKALQDRYLRSYAHLYECRRGNLRALDALLENDPELRRYMKTGASVDPKGLESMEKDLMERLRNIALLSEQIRPRLDQYRAEQRELDDLSRAGEETFRKARVTMLVWARSHGNLAAGIDVPPPIDMVDVLASAASASAKKALTLR